MAEGRTRAGPSVRVGTVRPLATTAAGGPAVAPSRDRCSSLSRLGEAVADSEHGFDVRLPDLLPDVLDVRVDRALVRLERNASHRIEQLRTREYPARLPGHQGHDLEL